MVPLSPHGAELEDQSHGLSLGMHCVDEDNVEREHWHFKGRKEHGAYDG